MVHVASWSIKLTLCILWYKKIVLLGFLELDDLTNLIELLEPLFVVELIADLGNGLIDWLTVLIEGEILKFSNIKEEKSVSEIWYAFPY